MDISDPGYAVEARRLAIQIVATLVNLKKGAAKRLLTPAGVDDEAVRRFLAARDPLTNGKASKREAVTALLNDLKQAGRDGDFVRRLIALAADWDDFHLAANEFEARAVVQKAREMNGSLVEAETREREAAASRADAAERRLRSERGARVHAGSPLLLSMLDHLAGGGADTPQQRGLLLEDLLNRVFDLHGVAVTRSFTRNGGGEQIDAAFEFDGWHYLVECRWRDRLADTRELDGLVGQVARSGRQTMGLFLSINGWSENVPGLLKQNPDKSVVLMHGYDLRLILDRPLDLRAALKAKLSALNLEAEPYAPLTGLPMAER